jgi:hypothetical protein
MNETEKVFVALLNEGTEVWRPVPAAHIRGTVYKLGGSVPEDEEWQFLPGQFVECENKTFSGGTTVLVAIRLCEPPNNGFQATSALTRRRA